MGAGWAWWSTHKVAGTHTRCWQTHRGHAQGDTISGFWGLEAVCSGHFSPVRGWVVSGELATASLLLSQLR